MKKKQTKQILRIVLLSWNHNLLVFCTMDFGKGVVGTTA